jgi:hypothetical protein
MGWDMVPKFIDSDVLALGVRTDFICRWELVAGAGIAPLLWYRSAKVAMDYNPIESILVVYLTESPRE